MSIILSSFYPPKTPQNLVRVIDSCIFSKSLDRLARLSVSHRSGYEAPHARNPPERRDTNPTIFAPLSYARLAPTNINLEQYDRSGRSSGVAVITFETPAEATRAKKQFDGILCKSNISSRPGLLLLVAGS